MTTTTMYLVDTLATEIKPLSRFDKLRLIQIISNMLMEETSEHEPPVPVYPMDTPYRQLEAAVQLQTFLNSLDDE